MYLDTAAVAAVLGAVSGWFVPRLIARLPEPSPVDAESSDGSAQTGDGPDGSAQTGDGPGGSALDEAEPGGSALDQAAPAKPLYTELAATPGLAWKCALATAVTAGVIGGAVGWAWPLTFLLFLCPVGVAL